MQRHRAMAKIEVYTDIRRGSYLKRLIIEDVVKTGNRVHFCLPVLSAGITPRLSGVDARDVKRVATYQPKNSSSDLLAAIKASKHERSPLGCPISRVSWPPDTTPATATYTYIYSPLLFFFLTPPFFRETRLGYCTISAIRTRIVSCRGRVEIAVERRLSSIVNFQTIISQQCHWLPLRGNTEVIAIAVVQRLALNLISNALSPRAYVDPSISIVWRNPTRLCATINYRWQIQIRWIRIGWTAYFVDYRIATAICISSRQSVRSLRPIETAMMNRRPTYRMIEESLNFTGWNSRGDSTPGLSSLNFTEDLWETMMQDWQIVADHD